PGSPGTPGARTAAWTPTSGTRSVSSQPEPATRQRPRSPSAPAARYEPSAWSCRCGTGTSASTASGAAWSHPTARTCAASAVGPGAGRGRTVSAEARPQGSAARGRLRIYLGYAPGAGTTCALLSEGRQRAEHGTDVVVASADTHGRPHTEGLLAGLEVTPSAKVPYSGTLAEEMDLDAVLARGPAVALV